MAEVRYQDSASVEPQTTVPTTGFHLDVNPNQFGGEIAQGLEKAGAGATAASNNFFDIQRFYGQAARDDQVNKFYDTQQKILFGDPNKTTLGPGGQPVQDTGYFGTQGQDAMTQRASALAQLESARQTGRQNLNPESQIEYDNQTRRMMAIASENIGKHADGQTKVWMNGVSEAKAQQTLQNYATGTDEDLNHAADFRTARQEQAQLKYGQNLSPEILKSVNNNANQELVIARTNQLMINNPQGALAYVNKYKDILGTDYSKIYENVKTNAEIKEDQSAAENNWNQAKVQLPTNNNFQLNTRTPNAPASGVAPLPSNSNTTQVPSLPPAGETIPKTNAQDALSMLRKSEGFQTQAYWDVNHWRVGYGSDTVTRPDGSVVPVTAMTQVSKEDAERDLTRRVNETQTSIQGQIGTDAWNKLTPGAQASLTSVAYNYGHLPSNIAVAAKFGDLKSLAQAIQARASNNNGINAQRRAKEAANVYGQFGLSGPQATSIPQPMRSLPPNASGVQNTQSEPDTLAHEMQNFEPSYLTQSPIVQTQSGPQALPPAPAPSLEAIKADAVQKILDQNLPWDRRQRQIANVNQIYNQYAELNQGLSNQISQVKKQVTEGYDVPETTWNDISNRVQAHGTGEMQQEFQAASQIRDDLKMFRGLPPDQISSYIQTKSAQLQGQYAPTFAQREVVDAENKYLEKLNKDIQSDSLTRAAQDKVIAPVAPLNIKGNPVDFAASLAARIPQAERVAQFYQKPIQYLTPNEKQQFQDLAAQGGTPVITAVSSVINQLGDRAPAFFNEVGGAAPQFATIGKLQLLGSDSSTLNDLATFQRLSQDKDITKQIIKLPEGNVQSEALKKYKNAFQAMPDFGANAQATAQKLIELRAMRNGIDPKDTPPSDVDKAFQEAAGARFEGNVQYGGLGEYKPSFWSSSQKIPLPLGMRADKITDAVQSLKDSDFAGNGPVAEDLKTPVSMNVVSKGNFVAVAHGIYCVAMGDPHSQDPKWLSKQDGSRFFLDLNAMRPIIQTRVPLAYK